MELPGNGKSDPMPPGLMISLYDLVYSIQVVVKHFRWDSFIYLGHSMGCTLGYIYNISYPGKITKIIQLDPITIGFVVPVEKFSNCALRVDKAVGDDTFLFFPRGYNAGVMPTDYGL
ncbi:jg15243 [Pararge aegeria aegeria]|uniref:Jg15243 protein n=1 Tax=Pararge aegeria aegeria TaxID=348720 RepID=A0A8S4QZU1_9NEOP|nr:jg15243 [Pararge aegeria aegeria]